MENKELKKLRVDFGVSQKEVAQALGMSISTYSLIESGKRRGSAVSWKKIKEYFKIKDEDMWRIQNPQE